MIKLPVNKVFPLLASFILLCSCTDVNDDYISDTQSGTSTSFLEITESTETSGVYEPASPETGYNISETEFSEETENDSVITESHTADIQHESPVESITETVEEKESITTYHKTTYPEADTEITVTSKPEYQNETDQQSFVVETGDAAGMSGSNKYKAMNYEDQKGIWISYLEYDSIMKNKTKSQFTSSIQDYFDNISDAGFNTVYVQVRAFGDAYYSSELFPFGDRFNGTMGTVASYDPLKIMINEAHSRGISIHAWINPMRLMTETQLNSLSDSFKVKKWYNDIRTKGKYIVCVDGRWYLNPAYDDVDKYICDGISEIVTRYNVDGIQIDDYFYPTTASYFDSAAYKASGTSQSLSKWRIQKINSMVKNMYDTVHSCNSSVVFGISPQGSIENNYGTLYADIKTWCSSSGYCDYILPQVYFGFNNPSLPFNKTISDWSKVVTNDDVQLVIGLAGYKVGVVDAYAGSAKNEWINNDDILGRQISSSTSLKNYGGFAVFRYESIFKPASSVSAHVNAELEGIKKEIE